MSQAPPRGRPASVAGTPREGRSPWRTRRQCQQGGRPLRGRGAVCSVVPRHRHSEQYWGARCRDHAAHSQPSALGTACILKRSMGDIRALHGLKAQDKSFLIHSLAFWQMGLFFPFRSMCFVQLK